MFGEWDSYSTQKYTQNNFHSENNVGVGGGGERGQRLKYQDLIFGKMIEMLFLRVLPT